MRTKIQPRLADPGEMRLHGFVSKPEIQKLNRNSIFVFVNGRLIRDRLVQHALTEAYRNIIPPTVYPGRACCFSKCPPARSTSTCIPQKLKSASANPRVMHDFVRDTVRAALMKARPAPQFTTEIHAHATASSGLTPGAREWEPPSDLAHASAPPAHAGYEPRGGFALQAPVAPPVSAHFQFEGGIAVEANAAIPVARGLESRFASAIPDIILDTIPDNGCAPALDTRGRRRNSRTLGRALHPPSPRPDPQFVHPRRK